MIVHPQRSTHSKVFYDPVIVDNGNGTLTVPAGSLWVRDTEYPLASYHPTVGSGPFRLWVEKIGSGADYFLDLTGLAPPVSFGLGVGSVVVAWRDKGDTDIHRLQSVSDAA